MAPLTVHDDQLQNALADLSFATLSRAETGTVHDGTNSISFEPDGWEAVYLHRPEALDVADYVVCLLPSTSNPSARQIAERTRAIIGETAMTIGSQSIGPVTVSIGVATLEAADDVASLIGRADACLYRAKDAGRNRVEG